MREVSSKKLQLCGVADLMSPKNHLTLSEPYSKSKEARESSENWIQQEYKYAKLQSGIHQVNDFAPELDGLLKKIDVTKSSSNKEREASAYALGLERQGNNFLENSFENQYNNSMDIRQEIVKVIDSKLEKEEKIGLLVELFNSQISSLTPEVIRQNPKNLSYTCSLLPADKVSYAERKVYPEYAKMNPIEFLRCIWGGLIDNGVVYQDDIGKCDKTLIPSVRAYCQRKNLVASDYLPPPRHLRTDNALANLSSEELNAAMRLAERNRSKIRRSIKSGINP